MKQIYALSIFLLTSNAQAMLEPSAECSLFTSACGAQILQVTKQFVELRKIAVSPDGKTIAIKPTQAASHINILDRTTGMIQSISYDGFTAMGLPNGETLAVASKVEGYGHVLWFKKDNPTWVQIKCEKSSYTDYIVAFTASEDGATLFKATRHGYIGFYNVSSLQSHVFKEPVRGSVVDVMCSPNLAVCVGTKESFDVYRGTEHIQVPTHSPLTTIAAHDNDLVLSGHDDGTVCLWDTRNLQKPAETTKIAQMPILGLHYVGKNVYAAHTLSEDRTRSQLHIRGMNQTCFSYPDPSVAYAYDPAHETLVAATGNNKITDLDIHAIK